jgi:hypothetical protein
MKKLWYVSVMVIPLIVLVLFTSCPSTDSGSGTYYIRASFDGTIHEWTLGLTNIEKNAFGSFYPSDPGVEFVGTQTPVKSTAPEPANSAYFYIFPASAAPASYTMAQMDDAYFRIAGTYWDFTDIAFEITAFNAVGGTIECTFSGTVDEFGGSGTMTVTDGQMMVKRAVNDAW